ncbi:hypothetical protein [Shewanella waksmanii]|uniref:hypothetical protein n=1 Tax=Shewanella waksmanii TaxID=213783 RepID=UPI0037355B60
MNLSLLSTQKNLDDNTQALATCVELLNDVPNNEQHILAAKTAEQLVVYLGDSDNKLTKELDYEQADLQIILQLVALANWPTNSPQFSELIHRLYQSELPELTCLAPRCCLFLGQHFAPVEFPLALAQQPVLFNQHLLYRFYHRCLSESDIQAYRQQFSLSPLTELYLDVLSYRGQNFIKIVRKFIELEYMDSHLFEVFVTSLPELEASKLVNMLSGEERHIAFVIKTMALTGYCKFIPYLARYMMTVEQGQAAFIAIRLILGSKLDHFIPLEVQFDSDEQALPQHWQYYGAKLLDAWQTQSVDLIHNQLLDGQTITMANIDNIIITTSRHHRKYALLHRKRLKPNLFTPHFDMLEWHA